MATAIEKDKVDLGRLDLKGEQVFVGLLPSGADAVMVKYRPMLQISCVMPPKDFNVSFAAGRAYGRNRRKKIVELTTPTLLMSCGLYEAPNPNNFSRVQGEYSLWVLDTERKNAIYVKPYLLANVWERGSICFGSLRPISLRQAYNYYWASGFNNELYRNQKHICVKKSHKYNWHRGCLCDGSMRNHVCSCPRTTHHKHTACGCTTVGASKKCRGSCGRDPECVCCKAIKKVQKEAQTQAKDRKKKKLGVRALAKLAIKDNEPYPDCGCGWRHKRGCACPKGACDCECKCGCCQKTCNHPVCDCACCKNECNCQCNCTSADKFMFHMANYHAMLMPKQRWRSRTEFFCGESYWASPKSSTGILISNSKRLLKQIPRQYWRKDQNGHALVVALATRTNEGWEFESGYHFSLNHSSVVIK